MSTSAGELTSGIAVVTGAGAGIGAGLAGEAARRGMTVVVSDVSPERANRVASEIRAAGGSAHPVTTDVRDPAAVEALAAYVKDTLGDVRLLINNAGIEMFGYLWELSPSQWKSAIDINVNGVFHGVRAFVPRMIDATKRGHRAAIANLSSVGGLGVSPLMTPYIVSKHAVQALTECLSLEMEAAGIPIDVSVITPGSVRSSIFIDAPSSHGEKRSQAEGFRMAMQKANEVSGMDVQAAATFMFEQLATRSFWISTQPEMTEYFAADRAQYLRDRRRPVLSDIMKQSLGIS